MSGWLTLADVSRLIGQRAGRVFRGEPVSREMLTAIIDAARWTGSARNRQPSRFVAGYDVTTRAGLARLGPYAAHLTAAPVVLVLLSPAEPLRDTAFNTTSELRVLPVNEA
jgi:nitroreductase